MQFTCISGIPVLDLLCCVFGFCHLRCQCLVWAAVSAVSLPCLTSHFTTARIPVISSTLFSHSHIPRIHGYHP
ncbi:hypothetical protein BC826DRAFT_1069916 [Russula brevipes]|nr:hypothetical protein BC826DRAFT_1069916 [Russula brevipes]